ncbi:MAG: hypothetical protein FJW27_08520 [Acidimicrobiia bacterium]|nr:hypothetical protein [Acidimicrobiia bacterium]
MDAHNWSVVSHMLDHALDLAAPDRQRWLEELGGELRAHRPYLKALLELGTSTGAGTFMGTLPRFALTASSTSVSDIEGEERHSPLAPDTIVGPYRLIRRLASGGHGSVWLATRADGLIDRTVAIKLPHGFAHRADLRMVLARERHILAGLNHPNIARLYDAGVTDAGVPFLALEYIEGVPITEHCETRALDTEARLGLFRQVVNAVAYAHGRLVIHRDLKPTNVLVTDQGDVRLLDFGIAALVEHKSGAVEQLPAICGHAMTLPYASPEQIRREPLGVASDIYALGVMLHELLTGALPYAPTRETPGGWEEAILDREPTRPSMVCADPVRRRTLRGDPDTIVLKALKKAPAERYATAAALGEDLDRYLRGLPVEAQGDSRAYRARKFIVRHRWGVAAAAATVAGLLSAAGVATWQMRDAQRQRDVALSSRQRAEAFGDFLETRLLDAGENGRPLTAMELLDRGAARLEQRSGLSDRVRAHMQFEVSRLYERFVQVEPARELLERSAETARRIGDLDLYAAARCAAAASLAMHNLAAAQTAFEDAQPWLAADESTRPLSRVDCARARAWLQRASGDLDGAVTVASEMLSTFERDSSAGESQRELLRAPLYRLCVDSDRPRDALGLSGRSLQALRDAGRTGSMAEILMLSTHAGHLYRVGEVHAAAVLQERVVAGVSRSDALIEPLAYRSNLGMSLTRLGQPARALELIASTLEPAKRVKNLRGQAIAHLNMSRALVGLDRLDEARQQLAAADAIWQAEPTAFRLDRAESSMQHAAILMAEGRGLEARSAIEALLQSMDCPTRLNARVLDRALRLGATIMLRVRDFAAADRLATDALARSRAMARDPFHSADVGAAALTRAQARLELSNVPGAREDAELATVALRNGLGASHPDTQAAERLLLRLGERTQARAES